MDPDLDSIKPFTLMSGDIFLRPISHSNIHALINPFLIFEMALHSAKSFKSPHMSYFSVCIYVYI